MKRTGVALSRRKSEDMQTEAAHVLEAGSYYKANRVLHRGSEKSSGSAVRDSAGVFCRCSFYAKDKNLKIAAYNAVILLSRTSSRSRYMQRILTNWLSSIQLCNVGMTWLNDVCGSLRGDVRSTGIDVNLPPCEAKDPCVAIGTPGTSTSHQLPPSLLLWMRLR